MNPLVQQGSLNRIRASIVFPSNPNLNVTASFLGRMGIRLSLDGDSTLYIPTMTGAVTSPEPYMMVTATIHMLKTQQLASLYKARMELNSLIGDGTIRPDSIALPPYQMTNCAIQSVREFNFSGEDADFAVAIRAYYLVNSSLFD
jgi:hypothetical protein